MSNQESESEKIARQIKEDMKKVFLSVQGKFLNETQDLLEPFIDFYMERFKLELKNIQTFFSDKNNYKAVYSGGDSMKIEPSNYYSLQNPEDTRFHFIWENRDYITAVGSYLSNQISHVTGNTFNCHIQPDENDAKKEGTVCIQITKGYAKSEKIFDDEE